MTSHVLEVAKAAIPAGVEAIPVTDRAQWLKMREQDITASVYGALFNDHTFTTPYQLWALKSGLVPEDDEQTPPMEAGELMEPVIAEVIRRRHPTWEILYPVGLYYREAVSRIGATPDMLAIDPDRPGFGIIQEKLVDPFDYRSTWQNGEAIPTWIVIQAIGEATLTGASWADVAPGRVQRGVHVDLLNVPLHAGIMAKVRSESLAMWKRIENKDPPLPDVNKDADTIVALHALDNGTTIDLAGHNRIGEIVEFWDKLKVRESDGAAAERERKKLDAEIKLIMGEAAYGRLADGRIILAKTQRRQNKAREAFESVFRTITIKDGAQA
jgi:hypothetical protein